MDIIGEGHIVSDENPVFDRYTLANEGVTRNFTTVPDFHTLLDFDKCSNFYVVPHFTTIQVDKPMDLNVFTQLDVRSNPLTRRRRIHTAAADRRG